jgi:hypothetical protein
MGWQRERARGECGFSSLTKKKIKGGNYAVFYFTEFFFFIFMKSLLWIFFKNGPLITTCTGFTPCC